MKCAYCDKPCQQTREHVIPRWYNGTPGETETFSARAPLTHVKGDPLIRDVCGACNNGPLSALDAYGKELYSRYFVTPVYFGEAVTFGYDGDRLIRWLLKLSYNSARAQNADARVLREYRKVMLGELPVPDRIRCWLHLASATSIDDDAKVIRAAKREERGSSHVEEPRWFRICQFRITDHPSLSLVQRAVVINSFAFTLLIARADEKWPSPVFDRWIKVFTDSYLAAKLIAPGVGSLTATTEWDHAAVSMYPALVNYPSRFQEEPNPSVEAALKGKLTLVMLNVPHELIEKGDTAPITLALRDMVSTAEKGLAFRQRIGLMVGGFDNDPRAIWQFPKAREYFRRLFIECPFVMLLAHPDGALLKLLAACWIYEDHLTEEIEKQRMGEFLNMAFRGLNALNHTLMLSEEQNRDLCVSAAKVLFGEAPPLPD